jgi:FlaA1/EpsC-like NDP-sugar epimerase
LGDILLLVLGTFVGYAARFDGVAGLVHLQHNASYLLLSIPFRLGILWLGGVYRVLWRHASARDFLRLGVAGAIAGFLNLLLGGYVLAPLGLIPSRVPLSVLTFSWVITILGPALLRGVERALFLSEQAETVATPPSQAGAAMPRRERRRRRILIAGAGEAGRIMVEEFRRRSGVEPIEPIGFLDGDPRKVGRTVAGLPVFGDASRLAEIVAHTKANELVIAIPSASGQRVREFAEAARVIGLPVRTLPGLLELATGRVTASALRNVQINDLLRREPIATDLAAVRRLVTGRRVLVTGAGGSIGSELCRQLAQCEPASLGLLGHGENSIFEIAGELRLRWPAVPCECLIADIRDRARMATVFDAFAPEVVFHAAAHKHVPLMEANPAEAVTNNIAGTWNIAELSAAHGVNRLVMISTDKAVRPTSVMGASKRVAEQLVQEIAIDRGVHFVAVRFGNVLGSRGSAVPIFLRQIEAGGPVTLTDPAMRRFFITIPEAVQLVLQASVLGRGGDVFALDMGEPVRIADLADDLIRLSGLEPGRDIEVIFTGIRPGEKLYEEVFFEGEGVTPTAHAKILHTITPTPPVGLTSVVREMETRANAGAAPSELRALLRRLVPEYTPDGLVDEFPVTRASNMLPPHVVGADAIGAPLLSDGR